MIALPAIGDLVKIWPFPGRKVQLGPRPVDILGGGRWMPVEGVEVEWSDFELLQLRAGDILLHAPPEAKPEAEKLKAEKPTRKLFDPAAAAKLEAELRAKELEELNPKPKAAETADKKPGANKDKG